MLDHINHISKPLCFYNFQLKLFKFRWAACGKHFSDACGSAWSLSSVRQKLELENVWCVQEIT